jgi:hypothetical protein
MTNRHGKAEEDRMTLGKAVLGSFELEMTLAETYRTEVKASIHPYRTEVKLVDENNSLSMSLSLCKNGSWKRGSKARPLFDIIKNKTAVLGDRRENVQSTSRFHTKGIIVLSDKQ